MSKTPFNRERKNSIVIGKNLFSKNLLQVSQLYGGIEDQNYQAVWRGFTPHKVKAYAWLAFKDKILTRASLSRRGWTGDNSCPICTLSPESTTHLFLECPQAQHIFEKLLLLFQIINILEIS